VHCSFENGVHDGTKLFFMNGFGGISKKNLYKFIFVDNCSKGEITLTMVS
jgi:hypothetical protein